MSTKQFTSHDVRPGATVSFMGGDAKEPAKRIFGTVSGPMVDYYVPVYVRDTDQTALIHLNNILSVRHD